MLIVANEYLIEMKEDIKKSIFISILDQKLGNLNFKIASLKKEFYIPSEQDENNIVA